MKEALESEKSSVPEKIISAKAPLEQQIGKLKEALEAEKNRVASAASPPLKGERKENPVGGGTRVIESTGPAKEEDFK